MYIVNIYSVRTRIFHYRTNVTCTIIIESLLSWLNSRVGAGRMRISPGGSQREGRVFQLLALNSHAVNLTNSMDLKITLISLHTAGRVSLFTYKCGPWRKKREFLHKVIWGWMCQEYAKN